MSAAFTGGALQRLLREFGRAFPGDADGLVGERAVLREGRDPSRHVHLLGDLVRLTDDLLVVQSHVTSPWPYDRPAGAHLLADGRR
jgi:hypothetical protein